MSRRTTITNNAINTAIGPTFRFVLNDMKQKRRAADQIASRIKVPRPVPNTKVVII